MGDNPRCFLKIGKLQFVADFLDTPAALFQQEINVLHHIAVDKLAGRFAADFLANRGQVLGRQTQLVGIIGHAARFGIRRREQRRVGLRTEVGKTADDIAEFIEKRRQQRTQQFLAVTKVRVRQARANQVVITTEVLHLIGSERQDRCLLEEHHHVPHIVSADQRQALQVVLGEHDAAEFEVHAAHAFPQHDIGMTNQDVVRIEVVRPPVDTDGRMAAQAQDEHEMLQLGDIPTLHVQQALNERYLPVTIQSRGILAVGQFIQIVLHKQIFRLIRTQSNTILLKQQSYISRHKCSKIPIFSTQDTCGKPANVNSIPSNDKKVKTRHKYRAAECKVSSQSSLSLPQEHCINL